MECGEAADEVEDRCRWPWKPDPGLSGGVGGKVIRSLGDGFGPWPRDFRSRSRSGCDSKRCRSVNDEFH
jgi:hypothetical protein